MRQTSADLREIRRLLGDRVTVEAARVGSLIDELLDLREAMCDATEKALELAARIVERDPDAPSPRLAAKIRARKP